VTAIWLLRLLGAASTVPAGKTVDAVRSAANSRLRTIQAIFIILGTYLAYKGFSSNSTGYSIFSEVTHASEGKPYAKVVFSLVTLMFFSMILGLSEPFKDNGRLARISLEDSKQNWTWIQRWITFPLRFDLQRFAKTVPAMRFRHYCESCPHRDNCQDKISLTEYRQSFAAPIWQLTENELDPKILARLLTESNACRLVHYWRVVFLYSAILEIFFYVAHRFVELFLIARTPQWWSWSLLMAAVFITFVAGVGRFNNSRHSDSLNRGVWGQFDTLCKEILNGASEEGHRRAYESGVCKRNSGKYSFREDQTSKVARVNLFDAQRTRMLLGEFDQVLTRKLARLLGLHKISEDKTRSAHVRGVFVSLVTYLSSVYQPGSPYRVTFARSLDSIVSSIGVGTVGGLVESITSQLDAKGVAGVSIGLSGEWAGSGTESVSTCSLLIAPLRFEEVHAEYLRRLASGDPGKLNLANSLCRNHGFLVVQSGLPNQFSPKTAETYLAVIAPFIHRVVFELVRNTMEKKRSIHAIHGQ
jgi:hypothetical protein